MSAPNRTHESFDYCYGASELGSCITAQVARRLGYDAMPPPAIVQGWFDAGHAHEEECLTAMRADGYWLFGEQTEYTIDCGNRIGVIVHVDAIKGSSDDVWIMQAVIECKSPPTWAKFERAVRTADFSDPLMERYAWQVSAQMVATGLECVVACVEEGRIKTFGVEVPIFTREQIVDRVCVIEGIASLGVLPECAGPEWPCPFAYIHSPAEPRTELDDPAVIELADQYAELALTIKVLEEKKKDAYAGLLALTPGKYAAGPHAITVYEQAGAVSLDRAAMKADGIELTKYEKVGKPSMRAKVTQRGEE